MNSFTFSGHLGRDAEQRRAQSGTAILSFSVPVTSGYGDKEKTTWVNCALFGKRAEGKLAGYLKKGTFVVVSGEMSLDTWEKDGQQKSAVKVNVDNLTLGGRPNSAGSNAQESAPMAGEGAGSGPADLSDEIPFSPER